MNKKHIFVILCVGILTYFNVLFNGFVGDDNLLFIHNTFYTSWKNFPRLFQPESILKDNKSLNVETPDKGPINPSFRLIDKMTFFIDYSLWGNRPMGYHVINILIHLINVMVLYLLISYLFSSWFGLLVSLLFCVHPIVCEPVDIITYRGDLLATGFVLGAFYAWVRFLDNTENKMYYVLSLLLCGLAFLTKESTVALPLIIISYQLFFKKKSLKKRYLVGFGLFLGIYLFTYFLVFPHQILLKESAGFVKQATSMAWIFLEYLKAFILPFSIHPLPPEHKPILEELMSVKTLEYVFVFLIVILLITNRAIRDKRVLLFLGWFALFYIPISGVISLPNPMTYRFIYLPIIGLCVIAVFIIDKLLRKMISSQSLLVTLWIAFFTVIIIYTVELNFLFKKDISVVASWVENYPKNQYGYFHLAEEYFKLNRLDKSQEVLELGLQKGIIGVDAKERLAYFYLIDGKSNKTEEILKGIIDEFPTKEYVYHNLLAVYNKEGKVAQAKQLENLIKERFIR